MHLLWFSDSIEGIESGSHAKNIEKMNVLNSIEILTPFRNDYAFFIDVPTHVVTLTQVGTSVYLGQTHLGTPL